MTIYYIVQSNGRDDTPWSIVKHIHGADGSLDVVEMFRYKDRKAAEKFCQELNA